MAANIVPSIYLMAAVGNGFACRSLWQIRGYEVLCINADDEISWMKSKRYADVIQRCADERLTLQWIDSDG